jgi:DNA-binding PadR family transcriptional regulator
MQDKILLGFLLFKDMTGYEVKKKMEMSTNFFYNSSFGSIYPAFDKLLKEENVTLKEEVENGRLKKKYSITPKGEKYFMNWLNENMIIDPPKCEELLRLFFFFKLDKSRQLEIIKNYYESLERTIFQLENLQKELANQKINSFQMATADYGLNFYKFNLNWYKTLYKKIQNDTL